MPNRDHEDSQYNRQEGRFESRDERDFREQNQREVRGWDRSREPLRHDAGSSGEHHYRPTEGDRGEHFGREPDWGHSARFDTRSDTRGRPGSGWYDERQGQRTTPQYGQSYGSQTFNPQSGYGAREFDRSRPQYESYGQANVRPFAASDQRTVEHSRFQGQGAREFDRGHGYGYGGREFSQQTHSQPDYRLAQDYGPSGREAHDESWGDQLRHAGQQFASRVKRAFRGPKGYKRSDERIREDVNDRLAQQDHFDPSEIEVSVASGEVTLTGTVLSRHEKFLAEEIADDVSGVTEVQNQLRVKREQPTVQTLTGTGSSGTIATHGTPESTKRTRPNTPRA